MLLKYVLGSHYVLPGFVAFSTEIRGRRSRRGGRDRDLVLVRNFPTDQNSIPFRTISASFKKSFFYRGVQNYNLLRREVDLDQYSFTTLRAVLCLYNYDSSGILCD